MFDRKHRAAARASVIGFGDDGRARRWGGKEGLAPDALLVAGKRWKWKRQK
jgi:hypothetical protein